MEQPDTLHTVQSVNGHSIRISQRQWLHVVEAHDYMAGNLDLVLETLAEPEILLQGERGELVALRTYDKTNISSKTAVVVYRNEENGFMITAFLTSRPDKIQRKREVVWKTTSS